MTHIWFWRSRLPERKGEPCEVVARGAMNSIKVRFADGFTVITRGRGLRALLRFDHVRGSGVMGPGMFDDLPKALAILAIVIFVLGFGLGHCEAGCNYAIKIAPKVSDGGAR